MKILAVDDSMLVRRLVASASSVIGADCIGAADGLLEGIGLRRVRQLVHDAGTLMVSLAPGSADSMRASAARPRMMSVFTLGSETESRRAISS